jgi:hypothetical protein
MNKTERKPAPYDDSCRLSETINHVGFNEKVGLTYKGLRNSVIY